MFSNFNPNIHGARGLFALSLFVFHVAISKLPSPVLPYYDAVQLALESFEFGVELFFVVSGIVIYGAFERASSLSSFFVNRATRIWPLLWVTMTVMFVLGYLGTDKLTEKAWLATTVYFLGNMLALPPMVHIPIYHPAAWSLSYEFAFYGLFVIFGLMAKRLPRRLAFVLMAGLAVAIYWHHVRAIYFVAGLFIAAGYADQRTIQRFTGYPLFWLLLFLASWKTLAVMVGGNIHAAVFTRLAGHPGLIALAVIAFISAFLALGGISQGRGYLARCLRMPVMQWLGTISFSLYLWQAPVLAIVKRVMYVLHVPQWAGGWSQPLFLLFALPVTLVISHYSQRYIEAGVTEKLRKTFKRKKSLLKPDSLQASVS